MTTEPRATDLAHSHPGLMAEPPSRPPETPPLALAGGRAGEPAAGSLKRAGLPGLLFFLAVGGWLGVMLFFAGVVTPQIFGALGTEAGGRVVGALFPRYYLFGTLCSLLGALSAWGAARRQGSGPPRAILLCLLAGAAITLLSWLWLEPLVAEARGGFRGALHVLSIGLNGVVFLLTAAALWLAVRR